MAHHAVPTACHGMAMVYVPRRRHDIFHARLGHPKGVHGIHENVAGMIMECHGASGHGHGASWYRLPWYATNNGMSLTWEIQRHFHGMFHGLANCHWGLWHSYSLTVTCWLMPLLCVKDGEDSALTVRPWSPMNGQPYGMPW